MFESRDPAAIIRTNLPWDPAPRFLAAHRALVYVAHAPIGRAEMPAPMIDIVDEARAPT